MDENGHDKGLEAVFDRVGNSIQPQGPASQWSPEEARAKKELELVKALQLEIQMVCSKHQLPPEATVSGISAALAVIILLNAADVETADSMRTDVRRILKDTITRNWAVMQPLKLKLRLQLEEQQRLANVESTEPRAEGPSEEDPPSGDVRSDSTG